MTTQNLVGKKVAILATDGFEQAELVSPKEALEAAGAIVEVVSDKTDTIQGFKHLEKADAIRVDKTFDQALAGDYDAVVLPGGVVNGDAMRLLPKAQRFIKQTDDEHKPIAVICHGTWLPISAGIVKGRTLTSWPSLQDDLRNAGARWLDQEVVHDGNFISSRKPDDLPAFNRTLIEVLAHAA
ncbi:MAG: type 1 glutamine amidotransferase domain-containing protein [Janthinobacterium lividum]